MYQGIFNKGYPHFPQRWCFPNLCFFCVLWVYFWRLLPLQRGREGRYKRFIFISWLHHMNTVRLNYLVTWETSNSVDRIHPYRINTTKIEPPPFSLMTPCITTDIKETSNISKRQCGTKYVNAKKTVKTTCKYWYKNTVNVKYLYITYTLNTFTVKS